MHETGHGEVAMLAHAFNTMADMVDERDRDLAMLRDQLQGVLDHTTAIIYLKDSSGAYQTVNHAFERRGTCGRLT